MWEEIILNTKWTILVFILGLVLFHISIPYSSKESWIKVDYLWLSLLIVPLIGATTGLQKTFLIQGEIPELEEDYLAQLNELTNQFYINSTREDLDSISQEWYKTNKRQLDIFEKETLLYLSKPVQTRQNVYTQKTREWKYDKLFLSNDQIMNHDILKSKYNNLSDIKEKMVEKIFEYQNKDYLNVFHFKFLLYYPFFLAIALSIRITKVTENLYGGKIRKEFNFGTVNVVKKYSVIIYKKIRKVLLIIFYDKKSRPK